MRTVEIFVVSVFWEMTFSVVGAVDVSCEMVVDVLTFICGDVLEIERVALSEELTAVLVECGIDVS